MRISDWSSDVCSSDLSDHMDHGVGAACACDLDTVSVARGDKAFDLGPVRQPGQIGRKSPIHIYLAVALRRTLLLRRQADRRDRQSVVSGQSVSVRVALGGRRFIKKKNQKT